VGRAMITSDRRSRTLLSWAIEGGDQVVAELVQDLAPKVLGEDHCRCAACVLMLASDP
jgi:hypothetical protein